MNNIVHILFTIQNKNMYLDSNSWIIFNFYYLDTTQNTFVSISIYLKQ